MQPPSLPLHPPNNKKRPDLNEAISNLFPKKDVPTTIDGGEKKSNTGIKKEASEKAKKRVEEEANIAAEKEEEEK